MQLGHRGQMLDDRLVQPVHGSRNPAVHAALAGGVHGQLFSAPSQEQTEASVNSNSPINGATNMLRSIGVMEPVDHAVSQLIA